MPCKHRLVAGGRSEALITTAAGLSVAIPALFCHRFLVLKIDELAIDMQQDAQSLVDHITAAPLSPMALTQPPHLTRYL